MYKYIRTVVSRGFRKHEDLAFEASKFLLLQEYHLLGSLPPQENGCVVPWREKCCMTLRSAPFVTSVLQEISDTLIPLLY